VPISYFGRILSTTFKDGGIDMKIETGKYNEQMSFGVTITNYQGQYKALILDLGIWYVEIIFQDYE